MNRDLSPPSTVRPTYVRYGVLAFACTLSMITYLDRASIGVAEKPIREALGLNSVADLWMALAAFNLAYAVFEVPTGWLGDVFGPRRTLIRIVLWWSLFTALTGLAGIRIYYGTNAGALTQTIDVPGPTTTSFIIERLAAGTYYFAVAAYTAAGTESALSNIASKTT